MTFCKRIASMLLILTMVLAWIPAEAVAIDETDSTPNGDVTTIPEASSSAEEQEGSIFDAASAEIPDDEPEAAENAEKPENDGIALLSAECSHQWQCTKLPQQVSYTCRNCEATYSVTTDEAVFVDSNLPKGQCGDTAFYARSTAGVLYIFGEGAMWDYNLNTSNYSPWWDNYRTSIYSVVFSDEITAIGAYTFPACQQITEITMGKVNSIGAGAFLSCTRLCTINYGGTKKEWDQVQIGAENDVLASEKLNVVCASDETPETHTHSYTAAVTAPSCQERGYTTYSCACGDSYVAEYVAAIGHSFGKYQETKTPTCAEAGEKIHTCTVCGGTETKSVPATGVHTYDAGIVTTEPTYVSAGVKTFTCTACGKTKTEAIPMIETEAVTIITQPLAVSAKVGDTAKYTVTATGSGLKYQWQYSTDNGKNWHNSPAMGNTTSTVSITVAANKNGYLYRCKITDSNGKTVISKAAKLTILLAITKQPADVSAKVGDTAKFTVTAAGIGVKYQWQYSKDSGKNWYNSPATGNTTATVSIAVASHKNGYLYRCVITDSNKKTVTSKAAKLIVLPAITKQPADASAKAGDTARFTITATGVGIKYQWQYSKNGGENWYNSPATGNTTATVSISVASHKNGYMYRCVITDSNGKTITSNAVKVTVTATGATISNP